MTPAVVGGPSKLLSPPPLGNRVYNYTLSMNSNAIFNDNRNVLRGPTIIGLLT